MTHGERRAYRFELCECIVGHWDYELGGRKCRDSFVAFVPTGDTWDYDRNNRGQQRVTTARDMITTQSLCILSQLQTEGASNIRLVLKGGQLWD